MLLKLIQLLKNNPAPNPFKLGVFIFLGRRQRFRFLENNSAGQFIDFKIFIRQKQARFMDRMIEFGVGNTADAKALRTDVLELADPGKGASQRCKGFLLR